MTPGANVPNMFKNSELDVNTVTSRYSSAIEPFVETAKMSLTQQRGTKPRRCQPRGNAESWWLAGLAVR